MHKRGLCHHAVSVCLSATFVNYVETNKHIIKTFSQSGSHTILVLPFDYDGTPPHPPNGGVECRWGGRNRDSEPIYGFTACC